jgi:hypothetical protein
VDYNWGKQTDVKGLIFNHEKHPHQFKVDKKFTTTDLTKQEFGDFLELINQDFLVEILHVDTSGFWEEYEKYSKWGEYNNEDFKRFMDEKVLTVPF